jgi:membrane-associated phospholipid phosphatase
LTSLAGQLNGLDAVPKRGDGAHDDALILHAAMSEATKAFFWNTGPTGQRAIKAFEKKYTAAATDGLAADVVTRSQDYGKAISDHILAWSQSDGGDVVENMGFPLTYQLTPGPAHWVPTSTIGQQQTPLLPNWGKNRPFAMPKGDSCRLPPPLEYSEDKNSAFYKDALEVYQTSKSLTAEQRIIARFWSDDPMLSPTPPGHWIGIALELLKAEGADAAKSVDVLARTGIAIADGFIACWDSKFHYDLLRPFTYIRRVIDPAWQSFIITPPFPEYPSGHSSQSGAAAAVLTQVYGESCAIDDATHERDGLKTRHFPSLWAAAEEAAISRMYGGIHFRNANVQGLEQGRNVGKYVNALKTRKS